MNLKQKRVFNQWSEIQKLKEENRNMRRELTSFKDILSKAVSKETEGIDYIIMNGVKQYI